MEDLLFELNQGSNTTLVLVTHDPELAKRCEKTVRIHGGKLSQQERNEGSEQPENLDVTVSEAIANAF